MREEDFNRFINAMGAYGYNFVNASNNYSIFEALARQLSTMGLGYTAEQIINIVLQDSRFRDIINWHELEENVFKDMLSVIANSLLINIRLYHMPTGAGLAVYHPVTDDVDNRAPIEVLQVAPSMATEINVNIGMIENHYFSLEASVDGNDRDINGNGAFHIIAAASDDTSNPLLSPMANLDIVNNYGMTPLHLAAFYGNQRMVDTLLANGASINNQDNDGNTALHIAVQRGALMVVEVLLRRGANASIINNNNNDAQQIAEITRNIPIIELLLETEHAELIDNWMGENRVETREVISIYNLNIQVLGDVLYMLSFMSYYGA